MKTRMPRVSSPLGQKRRGFALVATLSIIALLVILAMGLLGLSQNSLRRNTQDKARAEAQANARLSLALALGALQRQLGPDQRISANGAILPGSEIKNPQWTGVWDSWIAGPKSTAAVGPAYPSAESHHQTIGAQPDTSMRPEYAQKDKHFRGWLLSLLPEDADKILAAKDLDLGGKDFPGKEDKAVRLVGSGSARSTDYVSARLIDIASAKGGKARYGWWVGDESQKARVMDDSYAAQTTLTAAEKIYRSQAPASTGTKMVKGLAGISDDKQLDALPTYNTLDLVKGASGRPSGDNCHGITTSSRGVLADVREGGLKRDLSVILEQRIDLANQGPEYMLYEFDDSRFPYLGNSNDARRANSRVPIQDLAAYYQLYDDQPAFANGRRGGVQYSSSALPNSLQTNVPDYDGGSKNQQLFNREYTSLYRRPVVTKVQFLLGVTAQEITQADRDRVQAIIDGAINPYPQPYGLNGANLTWLNNLKANPLRASDTHRLRLGIQALVTLWNPANLPLVMNSPEIMTYTAPPFGIRIRKYRAAGTTFDSNWMNLSYANTSTGSVTTGQGTTALLRLRFGNNPIVFGPGEVKVFSLPSASAANLTDGGSNTLNLGRGTTFNVVNTWDPFGVFLLRNSAPAGAFGSSAPDAFPFTLDNNSQCLVFGPNDSIAISVDSENSASATNMRDGRNGSRDSEIRGAGFGLHMVDEGYILGNPQADALRHIFMISRHGSGSTPNRQALGDFYQQLMSPGFPGGVTPLPADALINAIPASQIIASTSAKEIIALMDFSLSIGCETSSGASGGAGGGRRIASRPFLHAATRAMPFIAQPEKDSLYDYGWDWQINKINAVEDSILQAKPGTGNGYYGGGYTVENGTTYVIHSEIPVLPPISIASLSHANLGGFSMAKAIPVGENPYTDKFNWNQTQVQDPTGVSFQRVTASGQNGLAPHMVQAIGNSYAHPNIPANKSFVAKQRVFDVDEGSKDIPFVDHSYLANKALWDEYFFSSLSPQPGKVELFGGSGRTAKQVAEEFFLGNGSRMLPNRRIIANKGSLNQAKLNKLFEEANVFSNGLADKIASHLLVEGAFNVNSTSVEAWKVLFSSLRGKPVAYLTSGKVPAEKVVPGTPVGPGMLPNAATVASAAITAPNDPPDQWKAWRELTDTEIEKLAEAMVEQVKLRGPFLSLSEFVNRRLDASNTGGMALKGALQAALDDPDVPINAPFRAPGRMLDAEVAGIPFAFLDAAKGPIAYGSSAYVDQADILRGLAEQLTPRGDTFSVRTYADSLDSSGKVLVRMWCEAVVQRTIDYLDPMDENHVKASALQSAANRHFGRSFRIVSFRWLDPNEV